MEIVISEYTKVIKKNKVLDNINLTLQAGNVYGFRGSNGCGKTMLMRAIAGLIYPTSGFVKIDEACVGKDISSPESIGILIENPAFLREYTGYQNLKMLSDMKRKYAKDQICEALTLVGLDANDKRRYGEYSLGMRQKLGIAAAIMGWPEIVILDEPINALDEESVKKVKKVVNMLKDRNSIVIVACHDRYELDVLADVIYIMEEGKIIGREDSRHDEVFARYKA